MAYALGLVVGVCVQPPPEKVEVVREVPVEVPVDRPYPVYVYPEVNLVPPSLGDGGLIHE